MIEDNVDNMQHHVISVVSGFFEKYFKTDAKNLASSFEQKYKTLLQQCDQEDTSEVEGFRRLITSFRPALTSVLQPCEEFDMLLTMVLWMFKASWEGAHRRKKKPSLQTYHPLRY